MGNLVYRKTARNFNPMMATAARITIAEVEQLVEPGAIEPDQVITPGRLREARCAGRNLREEDRAENRPVNASNDAITNESKSRGAPPSSCKTAST